MLEVQSDTSGILLALAVICGAVLPVQAALNAKMDRAVNRQGVGTELSPKIRT